MTRPTDLNCPGGFDKVDGVHPVLVHARADGQDVWVKDDVIGVEARLTDQEVISTRTDPHFLIRFCRLETQKTHEQRLYSQKSQIVNSLASSLRRLGYIFQYFAK